VRKIDLLRITCAFSVLLGFHATAQSPNPLDLVSKSNPVSTPLSCTQLDNNVQVPLQLLSGAKLKARLAFLLRLSLDDDAHGVLNVARDKEIKKLAEKLRNLKD
jgi:hypothetical protein